MIPTDPNSYNNDNVTCSFHKIENKGWYEIINNTEPQTKTTQLSFENCHLPLVGRPYVAAVFGTIVLMYAAGLSPGPLGKEFKLILLTSASAVDSNVGYNGIFTNV